MTSLETIPDDVLEYLRDSLAYDVHEISIPDAKTVIRKNGKIVPYYAVQFGDIQQGRIHSMAGSRGDDYVLPIYTQAIASNATISRRMGSQMNNVILGVGFDWAGDVRKRSGGAMFPIVASDGSAEGYQSPASFGLLIQFDDA